MVHTTPFKLLSFILLFPFFVNGVYARQDLLHQVSSVDRIAFSVFCKINIILSFETSKCFQDFNRTNSQELVSLEEKVQALEARFTTFSKIVPDQTYVSYPIQERVIVEPRYIQGPAGPQGVPGERGAVGPQGASGNLGSSGTLSAFANIPQPFWNGGGNNGGAVTIVQNNGTSLPSGGTIGQVLTINASGTPEWIIPVISTSSSTSSPFVLFANNGLTQSTTSTSTLVELGGVLTKNTTINTQGNSFIISEPLYTSSITGLLKQEGYFLSGLYNFPIGDIPQNIAEASPSLNPSLFTGLVRVYDDLGGTNRTMRAGFHTIECGDLFLGQSLCTSYEIGNLTDSNYQHGLKITRDVSRFISSGSLGRAEFTISGLGASLDSQNSVTGNNTKLDINQSSFDGVRFSHNLDFYTFPTSTPLVGQILTSINSSGQLGWSNQSSSTVSSTNGLTTYLSGVGLGGTLSTTTIIDQGSFNLTYTRVPPANTNSSFSLTNGERIVPLAPFFSSYNINLAGAYTQKAFSAPTNIGFGQMALGTSTSYAGMTRGVGEAGNPFFNATNYIPLQNGNVMSTRFLNSNYGATMDYNEYPAVGTTEILRSYMQTRNDGGVYIIGSAPASSTRAEGDFLANGNFFLRSRNHPISNIGTEYSGSILGGAQIMQYSPGFNTNFTLATSTGVRISDNGTNYTFPRTGVASGTIMGFDDATGQLKFLTPGQLGISTTTNSFATASNTATSIVNGITSTSSIINSNALSTSGTSLTSSVNGVATTTDLANLVASSTTNTINFATSTNILTSTVNGVTSTTSISVTASVSSSTIASNFGFIQDGNSFGTVATLGTNDNFDLTFETNATTTGRITANGLRISFGIGAQALTNRMNVMGENAGVGVTSGANSNFFGPSAGNGATNANSSNFFGINAGLNATNANSSNFLGSSAGSGATSAVSSNFFGSSAGSGATNASTANFFGLQAGFGASFASGANFLGQNAGQNATNASNSNFFGQSSGLSASSATNANFFGVSAGNGATNASNSNFFGPNAGQSATGANNSTFIGQVAGSSATGASHSFFVGNNAGNGATNASNSIFLGQTSGLSAVNARRSIFIGSNTGSGDTVNNTTNASDSSILLGFGTNTGGFSNSIAIGSYIGNTAARQLNIGNSIFATNIYAGPTFSTSTIPTSFVGIGTSTPTEKLQVEGSIRFSGAFMPNNLAGATGTLLMSQGIGIAPLWIATSSLGISASISSSTIASNFGFIQNGNSFGTTTVLGTNDNQDLVFETNATSTGRITANGLRISFGLGAQTLEDFMNSIGQNAGRGSTNTGASNFIGNSAGRNASNAFLSNFIGNSAGQNATGAEYSNFFGDGAGVGAVGAGKSNFFGQAAGSNATGASFSNFFGASAGSSASNTTNSNFFGLGAGNDGFNVSESNFFGSEAGDSAGNTTNSNFFGLRAGYGAGGTTNSNFFGQNAGDNAGGTTNSNFFGQNAGRDTGNIAGANFFGPNAGNGALNATRSTFIGISSGNADTVNNTGNATDSSILIGNNTNTGGFSNSIAIGAYTLNTAARQLNLGNSIYATDIHVGPTQSGTPVVTSFVGIGTSTPATKLQVIGDIRVGTTGSNGCIENFAGTALVGTCSSDETLKTNIVDVDSKDIQEKFSKLRFVSYNWNTTANDVYKRSTEEPVLGVLAQDVMQYFPELVSTDSKGYKTVNMTNLNWYGLIALKESLNSFSDSLFAKMREWFANAGNGIGAFFAKEVQTEKICVGNTCVTEAELIQLLQNAGVGSAGMPSQEFGNGGAENSNEESDDGGIATTTDQTDTPNVQENNNSEISEMPSELTQESQTTEEVIIQRP